MEMDEEKRRCSGRRGARRGETFGSKEHRSRLSGIDRRLGRVGNDINQNKTRTGGSFGSRERQRRLNGIDKKTCFIAGKLEN